jgi:hypothetical protein
VSIVREGFGSLPTPGWQALASDPEGAPSRSLLRGRTESSLHQIGRANLPS